MSEWKKLTDEQADWLDDRCGSKGYTEQTFARFIYINDFEYNGWETWEYADGGDGNLLINIHDREVAKSLGFPMNEENEEIMEHSGEKYKRLIHDLEGRTLGSVDVYSVLRAFSVTDPAIAHAVKKLLCAGIRGKGDERQDLTEAVDALNAKIKTMGEQ